MTVCRVNVMIICAMALCGRISPAPIGSREDRRRLEELRSATDASLLGAGTLRDGDPEMRGLGGALPEHRIRAIITDSGDIPVVDRSLFRNGAPPVIFTGADKVKDLRKKLGKRARVAALPRGAHGLSLKSLVTELEGMGARRILIEGGARLNYTALSEGVVDEIYLTVVPRLSGDAHAAALADGPNPLGDPFLELALVESTTTPAGELFLRYRVNKA